MKDFICAKNCTGNCFVFHRNNGTPSIAKAVFLFFLLSVYTTYQAEAQLPVCNDSFPSSLLINGSFEQYSGCSEEQPYLEGGFIDGPRLYGGVSVNGWRSFRGNTWEVHYINADCRSDKVGSMFDTRPFFTDQACAYFFPRVPLPLPDGKGFIAVTENGILVSNEKNIVKNYLTQCLSQPLYAGQTYLLTFYLGFGTKGIGRCPRGPLSESLPTYGVALFGRKDCPDYPLKEATVTAGCLKHEEGWVELGSVTLRGENEWVTGVIQFTPQENIACIGIGPDCANRSNDRDFYAMQYLDKAVLAPVADFSFRTITAVSGNACTGNYRLKAPAYGAATYQWYKDGVALPGATSQNYAVPDNADAAGTYVANISLPYNTCLNTLPFTVVFSDLSRFNLGKDTTLCAPATTSLDAHWGSAVTYLWQNGSQNDTIAVNKTGTYWVELTDNYGCVKRDSINVIVQGCDECLLFVPTAFTPNNDGLNDVFRVKPGCANIGLQDFHLRIFNRWGQLVFQSNDVSLGWNGRYKGKILAGAYVYQIDYSFRHNQPLQQKGTVVVVQ
ncbi:T9SS type B sorting domain-containing protein [Flavisolibacter nicotianae]|uniref:T9SS type B sorting domain-containing protein n=1 Tax=Flavisolibacter nicotianae TaxID=2364882 RepID=UPI000EAE54F3|nr:gliding motility-associated C-terminal domain-containing protein [Flavisolibacter nicotianae]